MRQGVAVVARTVKKQKRESIPGPCEGREWLAEKPAVANGSKSMTHGSKSMTQPPAQSALNARVPV